MKKIFFSLMLSFCVAGVLAAEKSPRVIKDSLAGSEYTRKMMIIPMGGSELFTYIYVFNTVEEGDKIAKEVYGVKNLKSLVQSKDFKKVMYLTPEQGIIGYNYGIFVHEKEFWIFRNDDNVRLYGLGRYLK